MFLTMNPETYAAKGFPSCDGICAGSVIAGGCAADVEDAIVNEVEIALLEG
jgi:hypothetical protein